MKITVLLVAAVLAALGISGGSAQLVRGALVASACSIDSMGIAHGFSVATSGSVPSAMSIAEAAAIEEFPGATIADEQVGVIKSDSIPPIDGRVAIVFSMQNVAPMQDSGGAAGKSELMQVDCAVVAYDATTGQFIVSIRDMEPLR